VSGVSFDRAPRVLFFYKVTCPVCQLAAPAVQRFEEAYPGHVAGVGQDPEGKLEAFSGQYGLSFPVAADDPPYPASLAYGVRVVPTVFLVDGRETILDVVESWDRDGLNRVSQRVAELAGTAYAPISTPDDGLPPFRPG
jgi:peroxiredoxin